MVAFAFATSCHQLPPQVRVKASNEVGWSIEPVQISCRTAERPHRPRQLSCVDLGALHEESRRSCQRRTNLHKTWQKLTKHYETSSQYQSIVEEVSFLGVSRARVHSERGQIILITLHVLSCFTYLIHTHIYIYSIYAFWIILAWRLVEQIMTGISITHCKSHLLISSTD